MGDDRRVESASHPAGLPGVVAGLALVSYAAACLFWLPETSWFPEWDSALYLLTGRSLAEGQGYTYLGQDFFLRPPGFPWLLSFFVSDGAYDFLVLNRLVMFFAATSVAACYFAFYEACGAWRTLGIVILTGTSALFVEGFNWVVADFPFVTLVFLAIGLLNRTSQGERGWWAWSLAGGLALAGAFYMRSAAVVVLPALLLAGLGRDSARQRWRSLLPVLVVVLLAVPWLGHTRAAAARAERPSEQLLLFDYSTAMWHVDPGDPDSARVSSRDWLQRIERNGRSLLGDLSASLHMKGILGVLVATALLLAGFGFRARRGVLLFEWFTAGYVLLLLIYFAYAPRLAMPLAPLLFFYLMEGVAGCSTWLGRRSGRSWVAPVALVCVFGVLFAANLTGLGKPRRLEGWRSGVYELAEWIRDNTPEDAVLLCYRAPVVSLLSDRRAYTYRFRPSSDPLARYDVDYVVLSPRPPSWLLRLVEGRSAESWRVAGRYVLQIQ